MKIKVAQCWDDGIVNDIRLTEMLRKYGAKATFNLNPGTMGETRGENLWADAPIREGWSHFGFRSGRLARKDIAEVYQGFELASHCWKHENAGSIPDDVWIESACRARSYLEDIVQKPCLGFAWPCGVFTDGTVAKLRERGFAYGRTTRNTDHVGACPEPLTLDASCHYQAWNFWQIFEKAKAESGIFYFWGHSYEMLDCDGLWKQLEIKIRTLSEDPDVEWVNVVDLVPPPAKA